MIKEAIKYVVDLGNTRLETIGSRVFSTQPIHVVKQPLPSSLEVNSLSGLVGFLKSKFDGDEKLLVHVESPVLVTVSSVLNEDANRKELIKAKALIPSFSFDQFYETEKINIKLQSCFVKNEDRDIMLKVVGNIREEQVNTIGDDGISQSVTAKMGVATLAQVQVPNPVVLAPYRTFVEVDQPESDFIFRLQNGPRCALFEADGGAWKLKAMKNIQTYLVDELEAEMADGKIIIIA
jgi:hypothetical protein